MIRLSKEDAIILHRAASRWIAQNPSHAKSPEVRELVLRLIEAEAAEPPLSEAAGPEAAEPPLSEAAGPCLVISVADPDMTLEARRIWLDTVKTTVERTTAGGDPVFRVEVIT